MRDKIHDMLVMTTSLCHTSSASCKKRINTLIDTRNYLSLLQITIKHHLKKIYNVDVCDLSPYYISNPKSLSESDLKLLEWYHIISGLNLVLYCTSWFINTLEQHGVSSLTIEVVEWHLTDVYVKTEYIGKLSETIGLRFILHQHRNCKLNKLGHKKHNYIIGSKTSEGLSILLVV